MAFANKANQKTFIANFEISEKRMWFALNFVFYDKTVLRVYYCCR